MCDVTYEFSRKEPTDGDNTVLMDGEKEIQFQQMKYDRVWGEVKNTRMKKQNTLAGTRTRTGM